MILSTKDFNKRQEESQQNAAGKVKKARGAEPIKIVKPDRAGKFLKIFLMNKTGCVGFVFYNVFGGSAEGR